MRLRKRAAALTLGAGVLFLLGTNVQAGWLYVMCALLLGTVVAGAILPGRMLRGIEVTRHVPEEVEQGDEIPVELIVSSRARGVRLGLRIDDAHVAPTSVYVTSVLPGERVELVTARLAAKRGVHQGSPVVLRSTAPFGVAERRRKLTVAGSTTVLPAVIGLSGLPFVSPASDLARASRQTSRRGGGPEYLGVREYRPGDSPRNVHWPSTARTGTIMVRELEEERSQRVAMLVDTLTDVGDVATPLDACCTAAASIARCALDDGHAIRSLSSVAPRGEIEMADEIDETSYRRRLAGLQPNGITLATAVEAAGTCLATVDEVILVFPTWRTNGDATLARAVEELAGGRPHVVAIVVEVGPEDARRIAALRPEEVDDVEAVLRRAGAEVYVWRHGQPLPTAFLVEAVMMP